MAEELGNIEPAAGDIFKPADHVDEKGVLISPATPLVPGMDVDPSSVIVPSPPVPAAPALDSVTE